MENSKEKKIMTHINHGDNNSGGDINIKKNKLLYCIAQPQQTHHLFVDQEVFQFGLVQLKLITRCAPHAGGGV